ncbi:MAG: penicillin-binding transpeptidase domain-containing protein [Candidatus Pristimantibacillus sp.]
MQVVKGDFWYNDAKTRWAAEEKFVAKRGTITDRNGNVLAMDALAYTVAVNPKLIDSLKIEDEVVKGLHELLGKPESELRKLVTAKKESGEFYPQREIRKEGYKIDKTTADKIKEFRTELAEKEDVKNKDVGIYLIDEKKRYYPRSSLAAQLLGYVTKDGEAQTGIESYFNEELTGEDGRMLFEKDGRRVQLATGDVDYQPAKDGQDITLTIDTEIQRYVEEAIKEISDKYSPKSITAVAADPNTMEILAMANWPTFNPNNYEKDYDNAYNHAIKSLYEPGSTFKIITLAAAVEEGLFKADEIYQSGSINIHGDTVRDSNKVGWGKISYLDGLKHSSNVAFVKLGLEKLGGQKLVEYINRFGFGQKTGISLAGELPGVININQSIPHNIASASFGQGPVSVTAIQQVAAVAAVANGGKLLQPQIVKEMYDPVTKTTQTYDPKFMRQVISEDTSKKVGEYLEQVVSDQKIGTGKNAYIEGYRVAGKTGTAQKVVSGSKGYSKNKFVVSFIGYAPVEDPKIVLYIIVDEPDTISGGGTVAAPAFKDIVYKSLRHMGVAPNITETDPETKKEVTVQVPDMKDLKVSLAKAKLKELALSYEMVGEGTTIVQQIPAAGHTIHPTQKIYLITEQRDKLKVPDLTGVALRDALEIASVLDIRLLIEGEGYVVEQKEEMKNGERVLRLILEPPLGSSDATEDSTDASAADSDDQAEAANTE